MTCRLLCLLCQSSLLILSIDPLHFLLMSYLSLDLEGSDSSPMKILQESFGIIPLASHVLEARVVVKYIFLDNDGIKTG